VFDENLSKNIKALAYEKSIDVERVFKALEDALATAARKYYKTREPMETIIDRVSGKIRLSYLTKEVVDVVRDPNTQIRTWEAQKIDSDVEQGDEVHIPITKQADEFGRIAAQSAKQVLYQKVREA